MIVTLKEKNKEIKKLETFKKKIEDRYKEKVKEIKDARKDNKILEDFVKSIIPMNKAPNMLDKDGKIALDIETLSKHHTELYINNRKEKDSNNNNNNNNNNNGMNDLINIMKEENDSLKRKIADLT